MIVNSTPIKHHTKWTYIKLCHTYIHTSYTYMHTYIHMHMHALHGGKILCNKVAPSNYTTKKNTHLMLYKPFRRIPCLKDGPCLKDSLIYQGLRERTTLKRTPNLKSKGLLQRQRMLNQQWVLMAFFCTVCFFFFFFFFFPLSALHLIHPSF